MDYELSAMDRKGMLEKISSLENMLKDMEADFVKCARGISPCFFCVNDDFCDGSGCCFVWKPHEED